MNAATTSLLRLAALVGCALLACAATASAKTPRATTTTAAKAPVGATGKKCWQALIKDWYDGRIDRTYPVHCYKDALRHLPTDVKTYSDAYDVISRALADATRGQKTADPNELVPPPGGGGGTVGGSGTTTTTPGGSSGGSSGGPDPTTGEPSAGGPIAGVANSGDRGADGVPIPLLVLGGLALLLVAAGVAGLVARRIQARRGGGPPATP